MSTYLRSFVVLIAATCLAGACAGNSDSAGTTGSGGSTGRGGSGSGTGGASSGQGGSGGGNPTGGTGGTGGSNPGTGGTGGSTSTGGTGGGSAGSPGGCPTGAIFCADFEEASGLPPGATFQDPDESGGGAKFGDANLMTLDTTAPHAGAQSLKVTSPGAFHYRMLGVTVPQTFWVRLFIKSDQDIGQDGHNAFFIAMTDPNYHTSTHSVEVSEQFTCILLNEHDTLFPTGTTCAANKALPKNMWHCMEAKFDGSTGDVQVFANGTMIVNAPAWAPAKAAFNTFEFGYANYHDPAASVWYDDVAIATSRVGCP